ncbi:MAG: N-6 DNA methylase [Gammaproteobacteria bacterium]|nr:N-6 DNA methylase [Gammaproteobacteria bacterium]MCY4322579.1 N-6 DNA methylase [Gammaproteobacteria bacterium]
MGTAKQSGSRNRYETVTDIKSDGAVYTPKPLANFVSSHIVDTASDMQKRNSLRLLDPAVGHGELLFRLLEHMPEPWTQSIEVCGFETNEKALDTARQRLLQRFPAITISFESRSFLEYVIAHFETRTQGDLFINSSPDLYDLVIANPPYVRTQVLGTRQARKLSRQFGLSGRVDLYQPFILGISQVLHPLGVAGIIVSNRFMTTRSGSSIRRTLFQHSNVRHVWDLGDTKLFDAAVLPAVLLLEGSASKINKKTRPAFTTIYETSDSPVHSASDTISALEKDGVVEIEDGRRFRVQHGELDTNGNSDGTWRLATKSTDIWLRSVDRHTWGTFRDIGKVRVGVKTCADKVFIRSDWQNMAKLPELLQPVTTHQISRRFRPLRSDQPMYILYPHEVVDGCRRAIDITLYPGANEYLCAHRSTLEARKYVIESGRRWYEIWVPQDPNTWDLPKLVFRDIADRPTFWLDFEGSIVNGDCYWMVPDKPLDSDLLWLAASVANSSFIERFYDLRFNNKLYAGRRRFITQYVEKFPLPNPSSELSKKIIFKAKRLYQNISSPVATRLEQELDILIWQSLTGSRPE